jgi:hypothetical protein
MYGLHVCLYATAATALLPTGNSAAAATVAAAKAGAGAAQVGDKGAGHLGGVCRAVTRQQRILHQGDSPLCRPPAVTCAAAWCHACCSGLQLADCLMVVYVCLLQCHTLWGAAGSPVCVHFDTQLDFGSITVISLQHGNSTHEAMRYSNCCSELSAQHGV